MDGFCTNSNGGLSLNRKIIVLIMDTGYRKMSSLAMMYVLQDKRLDNSRDLLWTSQEIQIHLLLTPCMS